MLKFQKLISIISILSVSVMSSMPAFANESNTTDEIFVTEKDGVYINAYEESNALVAQSTEEPGVYLLNDDCYLYDTGSEQYQVVDRIEVSLSDPDIVDTLEEIDLRTEVKADIMEKSAKAIANNNTDAKVIVYGQPRQEARINTTTNYTYKGAKMQDQLTYYYGLETGYEYIESGSSSNQIANSVSNIVISATGIASRSISIFSTAITAYKEFEKITGTTPLTGHREDFIQINVRYDDYKKWTYCDIGSGWQFGSITQKVKLIKSDLLQYYFNYYGGRSVTSTKSYNTTYTTANFDSPAAKAYQFVGSGYFEEITAKVYKHPINF